MTIVDSMYTNTVVSLGVDVTIEVSVMVALEIVGEIVKSWPETLGVNTRSSGGERVRDGNEVGLGINEVVVGMVETFKFEVAKTPVFADVTWLNAEEKFKELTDAGAIVLEALEVASSRGAVEERSRGGIEFSEDAGIVNESMELGDTLVTDELFNVWLGEIARLGWETVDNGGGDEEVSSKDVAEESNVSLEDCGDIDEPLAMDGDVPGDETLDTEKVEVLEVA